MMNNSVSVAKKSTDSFIVGETVTHTYARRGEK